MPLGLRTERPGLREGCGRREGRVSTKRKAARMCVAHVWLMARVPGRALLSVRKERRGLAVKAPCYCILQQHDVAPSLFEMFITDALRTGVWG